MVKSSKPLHVGIVGGGIAGATAAIKLVELGVKVSVFERKEGLVDGPPICHLHAGGNLYREISEKQCIELLRQSIDSIKLYPYTINVRPTIIAVPETDYSDPSSLVQRLEAIQVEYQKLVNQDPSNKLLGEPCNYYKLYGKPELMALRDKHQDLTRLTHDDWMIPFAKYVDLDNLKYPVVLVQEYGWSLFRLAANTELLLATNDLCQLHLSTEVSSIERVDKRWAINSIDSENNHEKVLVDYLVNACGFETGTLDDWVEHKKDRLVEFKAAYVTRWEEGTKHSKWPEVIFHGERGTIDGMAQLTPYQDGVFQLHGMTHDITLFKDGLVQSDTRSSQPKLPEYLLNKIQKGWSEEQILHRTRLAIEHISRFIPSFSDAEVAGVPLFGAQQIPGNDSTLRAADVSFAGGNYARIEIVKGSSAIEASQKIVSDIKLNNKVLIDGDLDAISPSSNAVEQKAISLAQQRGYPLELAAIYNPQANDA